MRIKRETVEQKGDLAFLQFLYDLVCVRGCFREDAYSGIINVQRNHLDHLSLDDCSLNFAQAKKR